MPKKIFIQLLFIIAIIAYGAYNDFDVYRLNGVILTVLIGLWMLATMMMIALKRATQQ